MLYRSPYPELPSPPDRNVHDLFFHRPEQVSWGNHTIHIDPVTGHKRGYREFLAHLQDAATALGASKLQGGLGLRGEDADIVGIMSENSMVDHQKILKIYTKVPVGLYHLGSRLSEDCHSLFANIVLFDVIRVQTCTDAVKSHMPFRSLEKPSHCSSHCKRDWISL